MRNSITRRTLISSGAVLPLALDTRVASTAPTPPPYTVSINIEIMFPREMPRAERMQRVADQGSKFYSFWSATDAEQDAMLKVQEQNGMKCASITGTGSLGSSSGLTKPGMEKGYLDEMAGRAKVAAKFGDAMPIIFVGRQQPDVPWETQLAQIVSGLKAAGEIAKEYGVGLVMEPLSTAAGQVRMALDTAAVAFLV